MSTRTIHSEPELGAEEMNRFGRYILRDHEAVPCPDLMTWGRWLEDGGNRIVQQDTLPNGVRVSTVFLGLDHQYGEGPPGAGRRMSRTEARRRFTVADLEAQTAGVECRKDDAVLDELPSAYKDIDMVMENQRDLVEVLHTLKQVLCVKGN